LFLGVIVVLVLEPLLLGTPFRWFDAVAMGGMSLVYVIPLVLFARAAV
jgi:hypothetical protein